MARPITLPLMGKLFKKELSATLSFKGSIEAVGDAWRQNAALTAVLAVIIFVPAVLIEVFAHLIPAWATIGISWFVGLLGGVVGLRAITHVREIRSG